MSITYLDHAAATPLDERVLAAMQPYFVDRYYNPSSVYSAGRLVSQDVETARKSVAHTLGARPVEITFTAGGTEANNIAIHGIMREYPDAHIVYSVIEHDSVRRAASVYDAVEAPVSEDGIVLLEELEACIDDKTVLVSVMYANNEMGSIQPIREISKRIDSIRASRRRRNVALPLYLHTDAAQAANYLDLHVARLGADLMTLNGGKIYGPKQCGALYVRSGVRLQPIIHGGGQEHNLRSGTENVPGIIGFTCALQIAQDMRLSESLRLKNLQRYFFDQVRLQIPSVVANGSITRRLPNNVHLTFPGCDNERVLFQLDELGIMAAAGSACSASHEESSHVLRAMGLSDESAHASLRFTMGRATQTSDIDKTVDALVGLFA